MTSEGNVLVGGEVRNWLESMIPVEIENWSGGGILTASLDGGDGGRDMFELDSYGTSMQPMVTAELKAKMSKDVKDAYSSGYSTTA